MVISGFSLVGQIMAVSTRSRRQDCAKTTDQQPVLAAGIICVRSFAAAFSALRPSLDALGREAEDAIGQPVSIASPTTSPEGRGPSGRPDSSNGVSRETSMS